MALKRFRVHVTVENKPSIRDPEGEIILKDLMIKNGFDAVKQVRTARLLKLEVEAEDEAQAETLVKKMCDELRIYNPVVSVCSISVSDGA